MQPEKLPQTCKTTEIEGRSVWLRILEAVKELMATKPAGPVH